MKRRLPMLPTLKDIIPELSSNELLEIYYRILHARVKSALLNELLRSSRLRDFVQPAPYRGNKEVRGNFVLLRLHLKDLQKRRRRKEYDELVGTVQVSLFVRGFW